MDQQLLPQPLTNTSFWDDHWSSMTLPLEIRKSEALFFDEITRIFDQFLPADRRLSVLELGGAPGQWLVYLYKKFGYKIHALDNSTVGVQKTQENFQILGIPGTAAVGNIFDHTLGRTDFDVVYSLGLIEHFTDPLPVVEAHLRFLRAGGVLVIGCPNFRGIHGFLERRLAPSVLAMHNLKVMDEASWESWETKLDLKLLFRGYIGGFEPGLVRVCESEAFRRKLLFTLVAMLRFILNRRIMRPLRRLNAPWWSGYLIGIYRKP